MTRSLFRDVSLVTAFVGLLGAGCSREAPVYPVEGQVLVDGAPAVGAVIEFCPVDPPPEPRTMSIRAGVSADGALHVRTYRLPRGDHPRPGAPAGEYVLTVSWFTQPDPGAPPEDRLRERYSDPAKSPLRVTIRTEKNVLEPIRLSLK